MKNFIIALAFLFGCSQPASTPTTDGRDGQDGTVGPKGDKGDVGPVGPAGPAGVTGPQGPQGPRGFDGSPGSNGTNGTNGQPGIQGPIGPVGPAGATGPQGVKGADGQPGATGPQGVPGPRGLQGAAGISLHVAQSNGTLIGFPVPWRSPTGVAEMAVFMHQDSPASDFPEGFIIPENPPSDIYFIGQNCTGTPLVKVPTVDWPFSNFMFWTPGNSTLYLRVGSVSSSAASVRSKSTGNCMNGSTAPQTWIELADSEDHFQMELTKPWALVYSQP